MALTSTYFSNIKGKSKFEAMDFQGSASRLLGMVNRAPFIYGTAWKGEMTQVHVMEAITAGFSAIDTAGHPLDYREELVGDAVRQMILEDRIRREDIFVSQ
jgi:diketogulonate reductase-like aldo/keto reductase